MRLGTRGSALALWQANWVRETILRRYPAQTVEIVTLKTAGDVSGERNVPLATEAGKGVFVREIEAALLRGDVDIAVHSAKDMTSGETPGLTIAAFCERADPRDALISPHGTLDKLPQGALVGTGSPRRVAQLAHIRPDLRFAPVRGNVDTRLQKLERGEADALVLAVAGLARLGRSAVVTQTLEPETCLPQVGQGCVAVQCRTGDNDIEAIVRDACNHPDTRLEVTAEREFLACIGGGCTAPVAAYAVGNENNLHLFALVARPDGSAVLKTHVVAAKSASTGVGRLAYQDLLTRGGGDMLAN